MHLRYKKAKKFPHNTKYQVVFVKKELHRWWMNSSYLQYESNAQEVEDIRRSLRNGGGRYVFKYTRNTKNRKVYDCVYLTDGMDVAMIKLTHPHLIKRVYVLDPID